METNVKTIKTGTKDNAPTPVVFRVGSGDTRESLRRFPGVPSKVEHRLFLLSFPPTTLFLGQAKSEVLCIWFFFLSQHI